MDSMDMWTGMLEMTDPVYNYWTYRAIEYGHIRWGWTEGVWLCWISILDRGFEEKQNAYNQLTSNTEPRYRVKGET